MNDEQRRAQLHMLDMEAMTFLTFAHDYAGGSEAYTAYICVPRDPKEPVMVRGIIHEPTATAHAIEKYITGLRMLADNMEQNYRDHLRNASH